MELLLIIGTIILVVVIVFIFAAKPKKIQWHKDVEKKLIQISTLQKQEGAASKITALLEYDKLLDFVLKAKGIKGMTMGERLKGAQKFFDNQLYNDIWSAHKIRNKVAHEMNYQPSEKELSIASSSLRKAIKLLLK
ncbi:hypothetical protein KC717_05770 [Candidatus Dojkabacteria bacterium]|uniref:DUF4145 domain-containing protein n=1 Tax=Candidatus Dojkabacteria bacterium TaxID=2099670 RepID=A0A955RLA9_9BACT|nr:hypothetical protein [Candidatus Dojkabacteria bacterium]